MLDLHALADGSLAAVRDSAPATSSASSPFAATHYRCELEICPSAICSCGDLVVVLTPLAAPLAPDPSGATLRLRVDPFERDAVSASGPPEEPADPADQALAAELTDASWELLERHFLAVKDSALQAFDPDDPDVEVPFPVDEIEKESRLVGFMDVFPYAPPFEIEVAGADFLVDDEYCVQASCECTTTTLVFVPIGDEAEDARWILDLDHRTGKVTPADQDLALNDAERAAWQALHAQVPHVQSTVAQRHAWLKKLYARHRRRQLATPVRRVKVGRNDPCPCGSGKKAKRCCGA